MNVVPATPENIAKAARYLRQGGLVAFPTETVYGLGADATNGLAVAGIFAVKGRPVFNPLIVHVAAAGEAFELTAADARARALAAAFWPGPLTLVVKRLEDCPFADIVTAGLPTVAIRCPRHPVALELLRAARCPVAAPSANRSGAVSPTTAEHVATEFADDVPIIVDGGATPVGIESTIIDVSGSAPRLLRPGGIAAADIERVLGQTIAMAPARPGLVPIAPGQLESHYAPRATVRLHALAVEPGEALLAFGPVQPEGAERACAQFNLSVTGDVVEAAANLFAALRRLDAAGVACIAVQPIPVEGLGAAINDRLARAAAMR